MSRSASAHSDVSAEGEAALWGVVGRSAGRRCECSEQQDAEARVVEGAKG